MAIADLAEYKTELAAQREIVAINVPSSTVVAGRQYDLWASAVPVGAAPSTAVVPTRSTVGALGQHNPASGQLSIIGARFSTLNPGQYIVCDRLSHQGGLSGIVTTAQTTNLPTAALTRYTSGAGVMIGVTIYSAVGTGVTTITASYTNEAGTSGRNTPTVVFGGTANREANRMVILPLQSGDFGVRAVASVTVAASTATAGNFGVTLFKPIYTICVPDMSGVLSAAGYITGSTCGGIATIVDDACLFVIAISQSTNAQGSGCILLSEN